MVSSCWKAFSNSLDLRAISGRSFFREGPHSLKHHCLRVNRAFHAALLQLHFDQLADGHRIRVEDRFALSAFCARESDGVAAGEDGEGGDGAERGGGGAEALALARDLRGEAQQRRVHSEETGAHRSCPRFEHAEERDAAAVEALAAKG